MSREFFCATSNVPFSSEEELHEHYRSAFHRYNLKRRVAGLGPVTKEWFDLHRDKLLSAANAKAQKEAEQVVYYDPLSRKTFNSESKYEEFTHSNKYKKLVKANGGVRPDPVIKAKPSQSAAAAAAENNNKSAESGALKLAGDEEAEAEGGDSESEWETASEDEFDKGFEGGAPWDACVSLFDNHRSASVEDNIEYMYKHFGFSIPDVEDLADPEGLVAYLGAKLSQGNIPLYASGLDPDAKTFASLHAVQRHMVDTGRTRMLYEENEEEYEDFYDYSLKEGEEALEDRMEGLQIAETSGSANVATTNGYELFLPSRKGRGSGAPQQTVLGSRKLFKYYKQSHRPTEQRQSVLVNQIVARYKVLGLLQAQEQGKELAAMNKSENKRRENHEDLKLHIGMQNAVINKLPRNVPY